MATPPGTAAAARQAASGYALRALPRQKTYTTSWDINFFRRSTRWRACRTGSTGTDLLRRRCAPRACIWRCSRSVSVLGIEPLIAECATRGDARKSEPIGSMNPGRLSRVDRRLPLVGAADPTLIWNRHPVPTDSVSRPSAVPGTHGPGLWITAAKVSDKRACRGGWFVRTCRTRVVRVRPKRDPVHPDSRRSGRTLVSVHPSLSAAGPGSALQSWLGLARSGRAGWVCRGRAGALMRQLGVSRLPTIGRRTRWARPRSTGRNNAKSDGGAGAARRLGLDRAGPGRDRSGLAFRRNER